MKKNKLLISNEFKKTLLAEANNNCANPNCLASIDFSNAHYNVVFDPRMQHTDNFIALCSKCSKQNLNGSIKQSEIQACKIFCLAINGSIQTRPMDMKLNILHNYHGLQAFFPDEYYAYSFIGGKIYLNISESQMMLTRTMNIYEPDKTQTIIDLLKPGQTFIDVGGNKGDFSLLAAKITGKQGHVLIFEPEPDNCRWIKKSIKLNNYKTIQLFDLALSDSNGAAQLYLGEKSGWHSLVTSQGKTDHSTIEVEKRTLDSILDENNIEQVDMIKIDVEGAEMDVLNGAEHLLKNNPELILLLDLHPHMGVDTVEVCDFLSHRGFSIREMKAPHNRLTKIDRTTTEVLVMQD